MQLYNWICNKCIIIITIVDLTFGKSCNRTIWYDYLVIIVSRTRRIAGTEVQGNDPFSVMTVETNSCGVRSYKRSRTIGLGDDPELSFNLCLPSESKKLLLSSPKNEHYYLDWMSQFGKQPTTYLTHCEQNSRYELALKICMFRSKQ